MAVSIKIVSSAVSGGAGSDTVTANDYANAAAAVAAISTGFLPVTQPADGGKARSINVARIEQIVSL
jgi:hypothetical protein